MTAPANRIERFVIHAAESVVRHWLLLMNILIVAVCFATLAVTVAETSRMAAQRRPHIPLL